MISAPCGSWRSPITSDFIVAESIGFGDLALDGDGVYWAEGRPSEAGRVTVVQHAPDGAARELTPAPWSARTTVHEYGGGAFVVKNGICYFSNYKDQRLYRSDGRSILPITPENQSRYADADFDIARDRLVCVREDHAAGGEPVSTLCAVDARGAHPLATLVAGAA
jgi:hypothetical protein